MKNLLIVFGVIAGLALLCGISLIPVYNQPAVLDAAVEKELADVQTAYQRRADLVPNLVETVKASSAFEEDVLTAVTEARSKATSIKLTSEDLSNPETMAKFQAAQAALSSSLGRLIATAEAYPALKSTEAYRDLMVQLEGSESRVATETIDANKAVQAYNTCVTTFPCSFAAGMRGYIKRSQFTAVEGSEVSPRVDFSDVKE